MRENNKNIYARRKIITFLRAFKVEIWGRREAEEIHLRSHGVAHRIGVWLSPVERLALAEAINDALAALRSPPHLTRAPQES